mgnify:CR=1 FL=1
MKKQLSVLLLTAFGAIGVLSAAPAFDDQSVKQDVKDAGSATKRAATKTGHNIKDGTETATDKTVDATKKAGRKVKKGTKKGLHKAASATEIRPRARSRRQREELKGVGDMSRPQRRFCGTRYQIDPILAFEEESDKSVQVRECFT